MSSRQYFDQLQASGTDFHNSGIAETDFLNEKKMEIDILGSTDESISDDESIYRSVAEKFNTITNKGNDDNDDNISEPNTITVTEFRADVFGSVSDDIIMKSLERSEHKEEIILTDTESEGDDEDEDKPTEVIDLDSSSDSSDVDVVVVARNVTFENIKEERERMEKIMNSEVEAEIKELERTFARDAGILTSKWDADWERDWGDGNVLTKHKNVHYTPSDDKGDGKPINRGSIFASRVYTNDTDLPQYASYMHLEPQKAEVRFNLFDLIKEFIVVMLLHLYLGIFNAMFNVITIDGIISCMIFYMGSIGFQKANNFLDKIRLITIDRYIYYLLLFAGVHVVNYITWFQCPELTRYLASIMICPSIMAQIYQVKAYAKIRQVLYDGYNNLVKRIICKQLAKIINMFIENVLAIDSRVSYVDLMKHYNEFDFVVINKFIVTFILAIIFNHVDKGSLRIPIMIYKNFYMKDADYSIQDDKLYLTTIIEDQRWEKFLDVYTLNRMIRMLIENDEEDADLSAIVMDFLKRQFFRFNRVMFCWSIMSLSRSLLGGILGFMLFVQHSEKRFRYALNVLIFSGISMVTDEKILILFLCELCFPILESKLIFDVTRDVYNSLKKGVINVYENTRAESMFFSILLSSLCFFGLNTIAMGVVICINLILMYRSRNSDLNIGTVRIVKVDKKEDDPNMKSIIDVTRDMSLSGIRNYLSMISGLTLIENRAPDTKKDNDEGMTYSINKNTDVFRYITYSIQNNLLYKTMISSDVVDKFDLYRMLAYYFSVLIFGYISGFALVHLLFLPIVIQNIVDIVWCP